MDEAIPANKPNQTAIMADSDALILVDEADRRLGHLSKDLCHEGAARAAARAHQAALAAILVE
jgi:hypothetical protein